VFYSFKSFLEIPLKLGTINQKYYKFYNFSTFFDQRINKLFLRIQLFIEFL